VTSEPDLPPKPPPADDIAPARLLVSELFADLPPALLAECAARAKPVDIAAGDALIRQGEAASDLFILLDGLIEILLEHGDEVPERVCVLGPGACVGDMALLLGEPRTATARALRPCRAARLDAKDFDWLLGAAPQFGARLARTLGERLRRTTRRENAPPAPTRIVLAFAAEGADRAGFAAALARALNDIGVAAASAATEDARPCRIDICDASDAPDARARLGAADHIVIIGAAGTPPPQSLAALRAFLQELHPRPSLCLALLQSRAAPFSGARPWIHATGVDNWRHLRIGEAADVAALARRIAGKSVGLALSGGGARGFAHIGVLKAFETLGIPIDYIAGASMGAAIGALYARGSSIPGIIDTARDLYVRGGRPDYALPFVALRSGRASNRQLAAVFGRARIENLPTPFFCTTSSLRDARTATHDMGLLWLWVRASTSVPGLLPPIRYRGDLLVDGGLLDNLPVARLRARFSGKIVASDVSVASDALGVTRAAKPSRVTRRLPRFLRKPETMPGIAQILTRTVSLASVRDSRAAGNPADCYLHPPVDDVSMTDFHRMDELVERGYVHALAALKELQPK